MKKEENFSFSDQELEEAAERVGQALLGALPEEAEPPHTFSREFEEKMDRLLRQEERRRGRLIRLRNVAAVFAAVLILAGTWLATDESAQAGFRRWFRLDSSYESVYQDYGPEQEGELPAYAPGWMPEGYELRYTVREEDMVSLIYVSQINGAILHLGYGYSADITVTGGFERDGESLSVAGQKGDFYPGEGGGSSVLVWTDGETGMLFALQANLDRGSMLKIAGSVEPVPEFTNNS